MVDTTFERLTSARLVLRRFRAADIETFVRYRADPAIARFQSWENFSAADGQAFFASLSGQHPDTPGEWFQFAIELAATGAMIGDCALHALADSRARSRSASRWRRAITATAMRRKPVARLLDYVFGPLAKERAMAITDVRNAASIAVLERLGFVRDPAPREPVIFKGEPCDEYLYGIRRDDWLARRRL